VTGYRRRQIVGDTGGVPVEPLYDPDRTVFEDLDITNIDAVNA
jgi:hypothetical protein